MAIDLHEKSGIFVLFFLQKKYALELYLITLKLTELILIRSSTNGYVET